MEVPRTRFHQADNLKNDQLEHGERQREGDAEHQLNQHIPYFVVAEQVIDEKPPSARKEAHLRKAKRNRKCILYVCRRSELSIPCTYLRDENNNCVLKKGHSGWCFGFLVD